MRLLLVFVIMLTSFNIDTMAMDKDVSVNAAAQDTSGKKSEMRLAKKKSKKTTEKHSQK